MISSSSGPRVERVARHAGVAVQQYSIVRTVRLDGSSSRSCVSSSAERDRSTPGRSSASRTALVRLVQAEARGAVSGRLRSSDAHEPARQVVDVEERAELAAAVQRLPRISEFVSVPGDRSDVRRAHSVPDPLQKALRDRIPCELRLEQRLPRRWPLATRRSSSPDEQRRPARRTSRRFPPLPVRDPPIGASSGSRHRSSPRRQPPAAARP